MASKDSRMSESLEQFCSITGADEEVGKRMLEACGDNLQVAIGMFLDQGEVGAVPDSDPSPPSGASAKPALGSRRRSSQKDEDVRAPIPQRAEVLVEDHNHAIYPDVGHRRSRQIHYLEDHFRDVAAESRIRLDLLEGRPVDLKTRTLEDLFRPPIDLLFKGSFEGAKCAGKKLNRWMLVNIQNVQEFACQVLNRDIWSNQTVRKIVKENFLLWQVYHTSEEGRKYSQFYQINNWPYVAVLDPRTGENMQVWHQFTPLGFAEELAAFLETHYYDEAAYQNAQKTRQKTIMDASEEDQLKAAIQASLEESQKASATTSSSQESDLSSLSGDEVETFTGSSEEDDATAPPPPKKRRSMTPKKSSSCASMTPKKASSCTIVRDNGECPSTNSCEASPGCSSTLTQASATVTAVDGHLNAEEAAEEWKVYLGKDTDPTYDLLLRFPDNEKAKLSLPSSSQLKALVLYATSKGFCSKDYELVTNFPRKNLSSMDPLTSLSDLNLNPRETVFVQLR